MSSTTKTGRTIRSLLISWLALLAAASLVATSGTACQQEVVVSGGGQGGENAATTNDEQGPVNQEQEENIFDEAYFEDHGPDDDQEVIDAGNLQGTWRAAFMEGDVPLAYFDIFHDEGSLTADGDFMAGPAISDMQDGTAGAIAGVMITGSEVVVEWNPTTDEEELYTLELSAENGDRYSGQFSAQRYPHSHQVSFTRQQFEE